MLTCCRPGRQAAAGSGQQPGRRRETLLDRVKRVANQPALAGPSGPSLVSVGESAIASRAPARYQNLTPTLTLSQP